MGHQPGRGNEEADRLAKSGSRKEQPQQAVSYTEAKTMLRPQTHGAIVLSRISLVFKVGAFKGPGVPQGWNDEKKQHPDVFPI
nr:hypothetical protein BaRGS_020490 [Batillaria attramentaria]